MAETKMRLVDWLDDLCVRFIVNLPQEELESVERICFQVEEAHWFYEDFIRPLDASLPSLNLRNFCLLIFKHCPLFSRFSQDDHLAAYSEFLAYKTRVPVRGAILLNDAMDQVVLVKGWKKGARWSFPRGKINKDEDDLDCAVREVYEETGYDARQDGLVKDESQMKSIEVSMREQHMRLYVFRGVPMDYLFEPRTRKEISKISWYKLSELPTLRKSRQAQGTGEGLLKENMFYMVAPFLGPLKGWIKQQKKLERRSAQVSMAEQSAADIEADEATESAAEPAPPLAAPPDGHLERLLAGLRGSKGPNVANILAAAASPQPVPDAASELKRLLSVNGQGPAAAVASASMSVSTKTATVQPVDNPLLSMLKGNVGPSPGVSASASMPPATPFDQIAATPAQPGTPHHQHPRPPPFPSMPSAPSFPYSPAHAHQIQHPSPHPSGPQARMPPQGPRLQPHFGPPHFRNDLPMGPPNQMMPSGPGFRPPQANFPHWQQQQRPAFSQPHRAVHPGFQQMPSHAARPYHRTGDPKFAPVPHQTTAPPIVPPASKLPPPRLNPHAAGLLNSFKGNRANEKSESQPAAPPVMKPFAAAAEIYKRPEEQQSPLPIRLAPQGPEVESAQPKPNEGIVDGQPPPVLIATKPRNEQQNALLNLFRKPSQTSPTALLQQTLAPPTGSEPVELSAVSPSIEQQNFAEPMQKNGPPRVEVQEKPGDLTSATVSGPLNTPSFEAVRNKHGKMGHANGRSPRASPKPRKKQEKAAPPQFSILTRPHPDVSATPSPKHVPGPSPGLSQQAQSQPQSSLETPKAEAQKPFAPQILRRPQGDVKSSEVRSTGQSYDRRDSMPSEQRNNLLSLFGKTAASNSSPPQVHSGLVSPVSPFPEKQGNPGSGQQRSRISSIASTDAAIRSARASVSSSKNPADKSFLLGYLNGVVKDAGK
ncbi:hypothetical protein IWX49DRAFT_577076 [Phyllosticta citricarpa]|uniref:Nudix hydrolase domain-containing protein n=1 Tax=Phyllosticta citricarpa TaxID=55181 RepID=A0ABR1LYV1_9PEZI